MGAIGRVRNWQVPSSEAARLTRLWEPDGSEVDLALLMGVECPDNPP